MYELQCRPAGRPWATKARPADAAAQADESQPLILHMRENRSHLSKEARVAAPRKRLGADGRKFNIVFVSADPEHDKPADLGLHVALLGAPIEAIKMGSGVDSAKAPRPGGDYTIDHTAAICVMTAQGRFSGTIDHQESEEKTLETLKRLVA